MSQIGSVELAEAERLLEAGWGPARRENSLWAANLQGTPPFLVPICAEKVLDSRILRRNSLRRRAGNILRGAGNAQGIFAAEQGTRAEAESADDPGPRTATDLLDKALERAPGSN
jgi:hypothetical protein